MAKLTYSRSTPNRAECARSRLLLSLPGDAIRSPRQSSPDQADLYVVNRDDNSIVQFVIGSDGKLYPQNTVNTPGVFPLAVAVSGNFLYVVDLYQPLPTCNPAAPCSGSVAVFPILTASQAGALNPSQPADTLGSPVSNTSISANYWPLDLPGAIASDVFVPTAVNVASSGSYVYITGYDSTTNLGYIFGFATGSDGTLTAIPGFPMQVGSQPSAVASDKTGELSLHHGCKEERSLRISRSPAAP